MGSLSIWHWLIVLVIVMLVFGTKKIKNIGADLGGAVKGFRSVAARPSKVKSGRRLKAEACTAGRGCAGARCPCPR